MIAKRVKILADEGLNGNLMKALRDDGYSVQWVQESYVGMADENIIALAKENQQILVTE
jgi:predicted nuclease of predicted toxin-antitoxin system